MDYLVWDLVLPEKRSYHLLKWFIRYLIITVPLNAAGIVLSSLFSYQCADLATWPLYYCIIRLVIPWISSFPFFCLPRTETLIYSSVLLFIGIGVEIGLVVWGSILQYGPTGQTCLANGNYVVWITVLVLLIYGYLSACCAPIGIISYCTTNPAKFKKNKGKESKTQSV